MAGRAPSPSPAERPFAQTWPQPLAARRGWLYRRRVAVDRRAASAQGLRPSRSPADPETSAHTRAGMAAGQAAPATAHSRSGTKPAGRHVLRRLRTRAAPQATGSMTDGAVGAAKQTVQWSWSHCPGWTGARRLREALPSLVGLHRGSRHLASARGPCLAAHMSSSDPVRSCCRRGQDGGQRTHARQPR